MDDLSIVTRFRVQYGSEFEPGKFFPLTVVKDGSARRVNLVTLSPWANFTFRIVAVNNVGESLPSKNTASQLCQTPQAGKFSAGKECHNQSRSVSTYLLPYTFTILSFYTASLLTT